MKALNNTELIFFCSQLALTLRSGISSLEGLSLMLEDSPGGDGHFPDVVPAVSGTSLCRSSGGEN